MFCPDCGKQVPEDDMKFCPYCGRSLSFKSQMVKDTSNGSYFNNVTDVNNDRSASSDHFSNSYEFNHTVRSYPTHSMGWYKFLINFSLIFGPIGNFILGLAMMTGGHYTQDGENYSAAIYKAIPELQFGDIFLAIALFALGIYGLWIRSELAEYKSGSPSHLITMQILSAVAIFIYLIIVYSALGEKATSEMTTYTTSTLIGSVVMIIVNYIYFEKRADMFDK